MPPIPPSEWLGRLLESLPVARRGRDPEGVHQVRVAAGRLGTWLRMQGLRVLRDDVRWLRRRAAAVRDLDVLLLSAPPPPFDGWLRRRRREERRRLLEALDAPRLKGLLDALPRLPPLDDGALAPKLSSLAVDVLEAGGVVEGTPDDLERLHDLRRALRRLRYGLEWAGRDSAEVKRLQDAFGELNDLAVALRLLGAYRWRERLPEYRTSLEARLAGARDRALGAWIRERARFAAMAG